MKFKCVYAQYTTQEVFSLLNDISRRQELPLTNGQIIGVYFTKGFLRSFQCFRKSLVCVACKRVGSIFLLEEIDGSICLRLYTENYSLMTKDHIIPKSLGGEHHAGNLQTMCVSCNRRKGNNPKWEIPPNEKVA